MKSRFHGRKVDGRTFLSEAIHGERNFTDTDLSKCDLAAHPQQVERFNQAMLDRIIPPTEPGYKELMQGNWLDLDSWMVHDLLERYDRKFQVERFYFTQANMSGFCAIGLWFPMADLRYTYLDCADLTECFMPRAMFDEAEGPSFVAQNADLRESAFLGARFLKANLSGCALQGSRLVQSSFVNGNFVGANLDGTEIENTDLSGCDFSGGSLLKVTGLTSANWSCTKFSKTRVTKDDANAIKTKRELDQLDTSTPEHRALKKGR